MFAEKETTSHPPHPVPLPLLLPSIRPLSSSSSSASSSLPPLLSSFSSSPSCRRPRYSELNIINKDIGQWLCKSGLLHGGQGSASIPVCLWRRFVGDATSAVINFDAVRVEVMAPLLLLGAGEALS